MKAMGCDPSLDPRVARLIDANLDRAREGLRVVEDWCRFGLDRKDLVVTLKDWRQRLGRLHHDRYKLVPPPPTQQPDLNTRPSWTATAPAELLLPTAAECRRP